jgi:hypothetical protein
MDTVALNPLPFVGAPLPVGVQPTGRQSFARQYGRIRGESSPKP